MKRFVVVLFLVSLAFAPLRAAEAQEAPEKDMTPWLWANFLILVGGLGYLAVKKGGPYFVSRSEEIRRGIAESEKAKMEADSRVAAINAKFADLDAEIASIHASVREEQAHDGERIQRETVAELARIQQRGEEEIAAAGKAARLELRRHAAQLSIDLAGRKLRQRMTPELQESLTKSFVRDLESSAGQVAPSAR